MNVSVSGNLGDIVARSSSEGDWIDLAEDRRWTAAEIDDRARQLAAMFAQRGFARGARIAMLADNGVKFLITYLAIMRAGLVAVPLNTRVPRDTIHYMMDDCDAEIAVIDPKYHHLIPETINTVDVTQIEAVSPSDRLAPVVPEKGEIAEILYTSGSTGRPKGVPLSHDGQLWALNRFVQVASKQPGRTLIAAPTYHMNGLFMSKVSLALGYFTVSMPLFRAREYLEAVARNRCTVLTGIPTMFALMAREDDLLASLDLTSVRDIIIGSAPLTQALVGRVRAIFPNAAVRNSYGTTETGAAMFGPHPEGKERPPLAIGYPYPDVEWRLVGGGDTNTGVLETRTPATLSGYLNLPDISADRICDGWYSTGDVLHRDADGFFHFVGRADDMFVCGGENVYPGEVEKLLERHPTILEAAVVPVEDEVKGAIPIAFVVAAPGRTIDLAEIKSFTLSEGPAYAHPRIIVELPAMPVGGTHKIDKATLAQQAQDLAHRLRR